MMNENDNYNRSWEKIEKFLRICYGLSSEYDQDILGKPENKPVQENKRIISDLAKELYAMHEDTSDRYRDLMDKVRHESEDIQYALFGKSFHRGCLCPSPIQEYLIDSKASKGRIVGTEPKRKPYYIYYYDRDGKLSGVEFFGNEKKEDCIQLFKPNSMFGNWEHTFELLFYKNNIQWGLTFDDDGVLIAASAVKSEEDKPVVYCYFHLLSETVYNYTFEKYEYKDTELVGVEYSVNGTAILRTHEVFGSSFQKAGVIRDKEKYVLKPEKGK